MKTNYGKLPKAFKTRWIAALRSGKFKQGTGTLKTVYQGWDSSLEKEYTVTEHCCLGVACEIQKIQINKRVAMIPNTEKYSKIPAILRGKTRDSLPSILAQKNDDGLSFKEIGKWIDKNL